MPTEKSVDQWLAALNHPQKDVISAIRQTLLAADPRIREGIKWNAGSFRTTEWFATFNVLGPKGAKPVALVLHRGAKARTEGLTAADPGGLLTWLGKDRAIVSFVDLADTTRRAPELTALAKAWIAGV